MADLTITPANVLATNSNTKIAHGIAGEVVTAGQVAYQDPATGAYSKADTDHATAAIRKPCGLFLNGAAAGQPVAVATSGPVTLGAVLTAAVGYYLSGTAGGICPVADVVAGDYPAFLGFAISATVLNVSIVEAGVVLA